MKHILRSKCILILALLISCDDPFAYSPFEVTVRPEFTRTTERNLNRISHGDTLGGAPFTIALIADTHYHYEKLADAVTHINARDKATFIIVIGDFTENGLLKEFELFHTIMGRSSMPYLTVIGNHDYLANGGEIYRQMYGPFNYTFTFNGVLFVAWDNVVWESEKDPDYEWLEETFRAQNDNGVSRGNSTHVIPLAHIPPSDQQFATRKDWYHNLLVGKGITLSVHGHKHQFSLLQLFGDNINFLTVGSPQFRTYTELLITPDEITIEKIEY